MNEGISMEIGSLYKVKLAHGIMLGTISILMDEVFMLLEAKPSVGYKDMKDIIILYKGKNIKTWTMYHSFDWAEKL